MASLLHHVAQVNIARMRAPLDDPLMAGFVALLDEVNAAADQSPGFVWRLQTEEGNATYLRPYDDDRILFNLSVWKSIDELKGYVYKSAHGQAMRVRGEWFVKMDAVYMAILWVEAGHIPTMGEAKRRLEYLEAHGETAHAFTFKRTFRARDRMDESFTVLPATPCPA